MKSAFPRAIQLARTASTSSVISPSAPRRSLESDFVQKLKDKKNKLKNNVQRKFEKISNKLRNKFLNNGSRGTLAESFQREGAMQQRLLSSTAQRSSSPGSSSQGSGSQGSSSKSGGPFDKWADSYGQDGKLRDYTKINLKKAPESLEWASNHKQLPEQLPRGAIIVDVGAAEGRAALHLGKRYPDAKILTVDTDPNSGQFIEENRKKLDFGKHVDTFTGTFLDAFSKGKVKENSVSFVNMDAVAPYLSDEVLKQTLENIHTALAAGGKLLLSGYGEKNYYNNENTGKNVKLRTDREMVDLLTQAGFKVECVENRLANNNGTYTKTTEEMTDVGTPRAMPMFYQEETENYVHQIRIAATKPEETAPEN